MVSVQPNLHNGQVRVRVRVRAGVRVRVGVRVGVGVRVEFRAGSVGIRTAQPTQRAG